MPGAPASTARRPAFLDRIALAGVGYSEVSRESSHSVLHLAIDACKDAVENAGISTDEIDGIATFSWAGDSVPAQAVATGLGLSRSPFLLDLSLGGQAPSFLIMLAAMAIDAGVANNVLVLRAMKGRSGQRVGSHQSTGGTASYRYPLGLSSYAQVIAMWAQRYLHETEATHEDLAAVPIAQRYHAASNPRAMRRSPLDLDEYRLSPLIAAPFRAADCTIEVDGACAVLVTSTARAKSLRHRPVVIRSAAYEAGPASGLDASDCLLWEDISRNYTNRLAARLWGWAGMAPQEVDMAQLYDCFSSSVIFALEGLGFAERGGGGEFIRDRSTGPGSRLPINTNGGLLCEGYLHGMNTVAEAVVQLQGRAGVRQVQGASTCVVTSGAMMDGSALVLSTE